MVKRLLSVVVCCMLVQCLSAQDKPTEPIPVLLQQLRSVEGALPKAGLLLALGDAYILKGDALVQDMDSAQLLINQAVAINRRLQNDSITGISLVLLAKLYREKGEREKGMAYAEEALDWSRQHGLAAQLAYAHAEMAAFYSWEDPKQLAIKVQYVKAAADNFGKTGRIAMQARTLEYLGDCLGLLNRSEESLAALHEAVRLYKAAGIAEIQGAYDLLGNRYTSLGDFQEGLKYMMLAVRTIELGTDTSTQWCTIYNRAGMACFKMDDYPEAITYYKKGIQYAERFRDTTALRYISANMASALQASGRYREALVLLHQTEKLAAFPDASSSLGYLNSLSHLYLCLQQPDSSRIYFERMAAIRKTIPADHTGILFYLHAAFRYYQGTGRYRTAMAYTDSLEVYCRRLGFRRELSLVEKYRFLADSAMGRAMSALGHYQRFIALRDSVIGEARQRQVNRLKIEFQAEKMDHDIQDLKKKQEEKDALLQQAGFRLNMIIGGALILLLFLALLYSRYQIKTKSNRLLLEQKQTIDQKNERLEVLNEDLQKLLQEKEWLLREIHHRVKNNLQIVISLLKTQSAYLDNGRAKDAIRQSQNRMFAMSIIHQRLYRHENVASIDMRAYISELVGYLRQSFDSSGHLHFSLNVACLELDVAQAVPIGLILNEAITNSIKYAFPEGRTGVIDVSLIREGDYDLLLSVSDNGVGVAPDIDPLTNKSMGMNLIRTLTEQLDGDLSIFQEDGLCLQIRFAVDESKRHAGSTSDKVLIER